MYLNDKWYLFYFCVLQTIFKTNIMEKFLLLIIIISNKYYSCCYLMIWYELTVCFLSPPFSVVFLCTPINSLKYCTVNNIILFDIWIWTWIPCYLWILKSWMFGWFFFFVFWFEIGKCFPPYWFLFFFSLLFW